MHCSRPFALFLSNIAVASARCGDADACIGTKFCATASFTKPIATTIITCIPTPTCLGVYEDCSSGGQTIGNCCSGYCAATKCRSTDDKWPDCKENGLPCLGNDNCCYGNRCIEGRCAK
ncbi:uncharacterized protein N7498_002664 [Penicillium cinerascens]|uniref:Uncharacterized protein n=1 Tax=Penicillium cinerascens TaxID=70096 RepID=A0A9W9TB39_9EURO|nr:uncharacterized protein N7498_002664 [Penicillium cinerascens]KAJ5216257.1 hypothetical protein N7498_002664 [Penicillium cinerascens]